MVITIIFNKCSAVAEMGDRLAKIDMDQKVGTVPLVMGSCVLSNTIRPGPRAGLPSYQVAS